MSATTKLAGFLVLLVASVVGATGIGKLVGPVGASPSANHAGMSGMDMGGSDQGTAMPKGLMVSQDGYTLRLARASTAAGAAIPVSLAILGPDARPVTKYDVEHDKELHLIAVRRDFTGFQHVHPVMASDGTWTTTLDLTPGQWRLFADFKATGAEPLTLGNDLAVGGNYLPVAPGADSRTSIVDGYTVTLNGDLAAGAEAKLTLTVARNGKRVTDLEPYLGAYGHLVTLRSGDLAYLHVHPEGSPGDGVTKPGPDVVFYAEVPSSGRYHLYLNFKHEGVVRTAAFTATVTGSAAGAVKESEPEESGAGHSGDTH